MAKKPQRKKKATVRSQPEYKPKDFLGMIAPTAVRFNTDGFIMGNTYRCVLALRSYPTSTEELALLRHLGEKSGVTLRVYTRKVTPAEESAILHNASNKSRMERSNTDNLKQSVTAEANLQDVVTLITTMQRNQEPLVHCAVFLELSAKSPDALQVLKDEVMAELTRSKLGVDNILLRQREGFQSSNPAGANAFGTLFERVLPAASVGNLYPFNHSGKRSRFRERMAGKELSGIVRPILIRGNESLPTDLLFFEEEITQIDHLLNFYMPVYFNPDGVFGLCVETDANCDYLNLYANYDLERGCVCDTLDVNLVRDTGPELECEYRLTPGEQELLRSKMDSYCMKQMGISLETTRAQYLAEDQSPVSQEEPSQKPVQQDGPTLLM